MITDRVIPCHASEHLGWMLGYAESRRPQWDALMARLGAPVAPAPGIAAFQYLLTELLRD